MQRVREFLLRTLPEATHDENRRPRRLAARGAHSADWWPLLLRADVQFFDEPFAGEDDAARALEPFDILLVTRERTPFPPSLVARLPRLSMFGLTGARAGLIDIAGHDRARDHGLLHRWRAGRELDRRDWRLASCSLRRETSRRATPPCAQGASSSARRSGACSPARRSGSSVSARSARKMAAYGSALDMKVVAWSQNLTAEAAAAAGATRVEKGELFAAADVVSVHLVLSPRTRGIVGPRSSA